VREASDDGLTASLEPGSLVVASCSSLYFWKAGPSFAYREGSSTVNALISLITSESSPGGAPPMKADAISVVFDMVRGSYCVELEGHQCSGTVKSWLRLSFTKLNCS
jgi:hypothetical protein